MNYKKNWKEVQYIPGLKAYKFVVTSNKDKSKWFVVEFETTDTVFKSGMKPNDYFGFWKTKKEAQEVAKYFRKMTKDTKQNFFKQVLRTLDGQ